MSAAEGRIETLEEELQRTKSALRITEAALEEEMSKGLSERRCDEYSEGYVDALKQQSNTLSEQVSRLRASNRTIGHQLDTVLIDLGRMLKTLSHLRRDMDE